MEILGLGSERRGAEQPGRAKKDEDDVSDGDDVDDRRHPVARH